MINLVMTFQQDNLMPVIDSFGFDSQYCFLSKDTSEALIADFFQKLFQYNRKYKFDIMLTASHSSEIRFYQIQEVLYIESLGKRKCINTSRETFEFYGQMYHIAKVTDKLGFVQVHEAFIISLRHIRVSDSRHVIMDDGKEINIGRKYLSRFRKAIRSQRFVSLMS